MFRFTLSAATELRLKHHRDLVQKFSAISDKDLAEKAELFFKHCEPPRFPKGSPVYDTTMHYVIIPELIKRLKK